MSGAIFTLTMESASLRGALGDFGELGANPRPLLEDIGAYGEATTQERFETGVDPNGVPWLLSLRAKTEGGKTLVRSSQLVSSINWQLVGDDAVAWGSNKIYAAIHQVGGTIRAKAGEFLRFVIGQRTIFAREVKIPKRAYLGLSESDQTGILGIVGDHVGRITAYWGA